MGHSPYEDRRILLQYIECAFLKNILYYNVLISVETRSVLIGIIEFVMVKNVDLILKPIPTMGQLKSTMSETINHGCAANFSSPSNTNFIVSSMFMFPLIIRFRAADESKRFSSVFSRIQFINIAPYFTLRFLIILVSKGWMKRIDDIIGQNVFRMCCILLSTGRVMDLNFVFNSLSRSYGLSEYMTTRAVYCYRFYRPPDIILTAIKLYLSRHHDLMIFATLEKSSY